MDKREARRLRRELTPEEKLRWQRAQEEAAGERENILAEGRRIKAARNRAQVAMHSNSSKRNGRRWA